MSSISRPDKFTVLSPNFLCSASVSYFEYLANISALVAASGNSNLIEMSTLEMSAGSKSFFLLVAQIRRTSLFSLSNESIFRNRVDKIRRVAS
jgi:hypothetical protein